MIVCCPGIIAYARRRALAARARGDIPIQKAAMDQSPRIYNPVVAFRACDIYSARPPFWVRGLPYAMCVQDRKDAVVFQTGDPMSQEYLSQLFGEREILETDESITMGPNEDMRDGLSVTRRRRTQRLILPAEFGGLEKFSCYVKMLHHDIALTSVDRKERPYIHPALREKTQNSLSERVQTANSEDVKL